MSEDKKQVISHEDGEKLLERLKGMQETVDNAEQATGLKLSEMADEFAKSKDEIESIAKQMEDDRKAFADEQRKAALESGDVSMKNMLDRFKGGYRAPKGDEDEYGAKTTAPPTIKNLIEGVQLSTGEEFFSPEHEDIERLRELNDNALLLNQIMRANDADAYAARGGIASLTATKEARRLAEGIFGKAATDMVDTTDLSNWVPTHFSSMLFDNIRLATPEISLWREITMPGKTLDLNVNMTDPEATFQAEITTNASANPFDDAVMQAITDTKVTLTAQKMRARIVFSGEVEEDAIVAQLPFYRDMLNEGMANALADAIINGDDNDDLDDTASSLTHFGKACPAASPDARIAWDGLRAMASDNTATPATEVDAAGADYSSALIGSVWERMGEYGVDVDKLVNIASPTSFMKLVQDPNFITKDLMGDMATLLTGSIGKVWGIPVVISRRYPQNMTGTDEKIGASGAVKTGALLVRKDLVVLGNRRRMTMGMDTYGATDSKDIFMFWRGDFGHLIADSKPWIGSLIDLLTV